VHLILNKCLNPICIYHSPRFAWTLCWSCELVGSRVVYSSVICSSLRAYGSSLGTLEYDVSNNLCHLFPLSVQLTPAGLVVERAGGGGWSWTLSLEDARQRGFIYTEHKPFGRPCQGVTHFFYKFRRNERPSFSIVCVTREGVIMYIPILGFQVREV
jgi:hypothetical protein